MKVCWNCHRSVEVAASTCTHCAAALPTTTAAPAAPSLGPMPVRARAKFVLQAPPTAAAPPPAGASGEPPREERSLKKALRENMRAATAMTLLASAIALAWWISAPAVPLGRSNCWSISEARRKNLFDRVLSATPREFDWDGRRISIEGAWLGQVGEVRQVSPFSDERAYVSTGQRRVYFKTRYAGWPDRPQYFHGDPPQPCGLVEPTARVKRFVLHYIDVASATPGPQVIVVRDPARPDLGSLKLVLN